MSKTKNKFSAEVRERGGVANINDAGQAPMRCPMNPAGIHRQHLSRQPLS